jgi:hypothetical protein
MRRLLVLPAILALLLSAAAASPAPPPIASVEPSPVVEPSGSATQDAVIELSDEFMDPFPPGPFDYSIVVTGGRPSVDTLQVTANDTVPAEFSVADDGQSASVKIAETPITGWPLVAVRCEADVHDGEDGLPVGTPVATKLDGQAFTFDVEPRLRYACHQSHHAPRSGGPAAAITLWVDAASIAVTRGTSDTHTCDTTGSEGFCSFLVTVAGGRDSARVAITIDLRRGERLVSFGCDADELGRTSQRRWAPTGNTVEFDAASYGNYTCYTYYAAIGASPRPTLVSRVISSLT